MKNHTPVDWWLAKLNCRGLLATRIDVVGVAVAAQETTEHLVLGLQIADALLKTGDLKGHFDTSSIGHNRTSK
jgi:hypothetical protein